MAKLLQTGIVINGKASPSLNKAFQVAQQNAEKTSKSMQSIGSVIAKVGTAVGTYLAVGKVVEFGKESVAAYNESVEAATKLTTVMKQRMKASDQQIASISNLTAAQQKLGVVEDDTQTAGAQQLATFLNSSNSLKTLIPAMNNLAVQQNGVNVTSENMVGIGNLMGKAMQGQTGALSRVGITFNKAQEEALKYGNEQQRAAVLAQVITDNVGEMNKAIANTPQGKIQQLKNTWGDMQETVGQTLMSIGVKLAPTLQKILPIVSKLADVAAPIISKIGDKLVPVVETLLNQYLLPNLPKIIDYISKINLDPILNGVQWVFEHGNVLMGIAPVILAIASAVKIWTVSQQLLNIAMSLNPIGLVVAGIAGLVAGFAVLWNKCEGFRNFWTGLWSGMKIGFVGFINVIIKGINLMVNNMLTPLNLLIKAANKIPGVKIPPMAFSIPQIPAFAEGGTVTRPQLAVVGDAAETIVPHGNSPRNRALLKEAAAGVGVSTSTGGGNIFNFSFSPVINGGGCNLEEQLFGAQERFKREMENVFRNQRRLSYGV